MKQKAPNNILEIDGPPNFQTRVANGQIEKPLATAGLIFEIGDNIFAEHFVLMKNLTGPIIGHAFCEEQQRGHSHDTRPHTFPTPDVAS